MNMNKWLKCSCLTLFLFCSQSVLAQKSVSNYIKKYETLAVQKMEEYGIPASVILGVSIVESASGRSAICKAFNNFFGIKGKNTNSVKKLGYKSAYKEYPNAKASFEHFCQVLKKKRFYKKLKGDTDYKQWLQAMNKAGYASAKSKWVNDISNIIKKNKLYRFDSGMAVLDSLPVF